MMMLMTAMLVLLMLVVVQIIMILQTEFVTKYIVSMREHGCRSAPTYITPTTTIFTTDSNTSSRRNNSDDHINIRATKTFRFNTETKEHRNCIIECSYPV
jgi:hypothetical protein